jgi:hypothetical protein
MSGPYVSATVTPRYFNTKEAPDVYNKETKKMNFLTRWFDRMCRESWERAQNMPSNPVRNNLVLTEDPGINSIDGLQIRLYGATGGQIVEFRKYDRHKDRTDCKLYVINAEQNFSEELAKIVSLEMLR